MEYEVIGDLIVFSNGFKVEIVGLSGNPRAIDISPYQRQAIDWELEKLRNKRTREFALYDKYQLSLMWQSLNPQQRSGYIQWRSDWLNVTETLVEPSRLNWFN